jgi:hypothetical protein
MCPHHSCDFKAVQQKTCLNSTAIDVVAGQLETKTIRKTIMGSLILFTCGGFGRDP